MHLRRHPRRYAFTTSMFMFLLDIDALSQVTREVPIISHNRFNVYSFNDRDHLRLGRETLRMNVEAYLQEQGIEQHPARIRLLTGLRVFGHVFNPVSFYFCDDASGEPFAIIAEVHNTFGEQKPYLVTQRCQEEPGRFEQSFLKHFYISPFSPLDPILELKLNQPGEHLALYVNSRHEGEPQPFFRSSLTGQRRPLNLSTLVYYSLRFPMIGLKVVALIHWHALRLFLKRVPWYSKSANPELQRGILPTQQTTKPL